MSNKFQELKAQLNTARDEAKKTFANIFTELFDKYPKLESVGWPGYAPYFNDGDPCTYSSHHDYNQYINGMCVDDIYNDEDEQGNSTFTATEIGEIADFISDSVGQFDDDDLEYMFGEGLVVVHRNGLVKVDDYDHD